MFVLFAYDTYYPSGGYGDFTGNYQTIDEAKSAFENRSGYYADICVTTDQGLTLAWTGERKGDEVVWQEEIKVQP